MNKKNRGKTSLPKNTKPDDNDIAQAAREHAHSLSRSIKGGLRHTNEVMDPLFRGHSVSRQTISSVDKDLGFARNKAKEKDYGQKSKEKANKPKFLSTRKGKALAAGGALAAAGALGGAYAYKKHLDKKKEEANDRKNS